MIIRISSPLTDTKGREMVERFRRDGFCPFGKPDLAMGWVREVEETETSFIITVEITEPGIARYFQTLDKKEKD